HQSLWSFVLLAIAAISFVHLGLFVSSFALVMVVLRLMGQRSLKRSALAGLIIAIALHLLFSVLLGLQLPPEIWEQFE
ncbi:MAG: tripartite tricarboxylate transporter TctB family protein, partial [Burkholderiaceae bacterium]